MLTIAPTTAQGQVVINEFSAANMNDFPDNFGDFEDWIELYNTGTTSFDLSGYHLSDKADNLSKWAFPAGTNIPASGHVRVWCSSRNVGSGANIHSSFKLTQTRASEGVYFSDPSGVVIDSNAILIPNQVGDSWGRTTDGAVDWAIFTTPTPNSTNSTVPKTDYAGTPVMTPNAGPLPGATPVTITIPTGTTVHYTTNGDFPNAGDPVYSSPITVSATTVIRAVAIPSDPTMLSSFVETNTYFIGPLHDVYIMSIAGDQVDNLLSGSYIEPIGSFELFSGDGTLLAEGVGDYNKHGNDSWAYPQRGIDYVARDQYGYDYAVRHEIFPEKDRKKYQRLIIKAAANDNYPFENGAHVRDYYTHALSHAADMRMDERTGDWAVMYVNGQYWGLYDLREKVDDHDFTEYYYDQDASDIDYLKTWGGTWEEYGSRTDWDALFNYIVVNNMAVDADYDYVKEQYNLGSLIDYTIFGSWTVCSDWLNWNTSWWRGRNPDGDKKKWRYTLWDLDATFGHYINYTGVPSTTPFADPCDPATLGGGSDPEGHMELLNNLFASTHFNDDYINRYADLTNWYLNCDYAVPFLDSLILEIEPEMNNQVARWGGSYAGWESAVTQLRTFIETRCAFITTGLEDCYGLDAYDITFEVDPPMAGKIQINTLEPPFYPFEATYFSGVEIDMEAKEADTWTFDYWELNNNTVLPSTFDKEVVMSLMEGDTIVAHFRETMLPIYPITVNVLPEGAGTVTVNTLEPALYPWDGAFTSGQLLEITANPNEGYSFDYWDLYNQFINPSPLSVDAFFAIATGDTLDAHFKIGTGINDDPVAGLNIHPTITTGTVNLSFTLQSGSDVRVALYSTDGRLIDVLREGSMPSGAQTMQFDLGQYSLAEGVYMLQIAANGFNSLEKVVVMR
ncbi:MAG: hypothetical protein ACI959_000101 [Limisphaerales bacterium]|jgi:hypothetical protein